MRMRIETSSKMSRAGLDRRMRLEQQNEDMGRMARENGSAR